MSNELSPVVQLRDLVTMEIVNRAIHVATDLNISDRLSEKPKTANELASEADAHGGSLYRVLRLLASIGIYNEDEDGRFELTPLAAMMKSGEKSLHSFIKMFSSPWNQGPFSKLTHAVRTGTSAFEASMGSSFFDYMKNNPQEEELFNIVMKDFLSPIHVAASKAYDFSSFSNLVDVGGGLGSLMMQVLALNPKLKGKVFDLASVIEDAEKHISGNACADRVEFVSGDFFEEIPAGGDAYILCRIIHDWNDKDAISILRRCRQAMNKNGKLLLVEQIVLPGNEPSFTKVTDLWMMMMFHEGRERTEQEFCDILEAADFRLNRIIKTEVNDSVIEAIPV